MTKEALGLKLLCVGLLYFIISGCNADGQENTEIEFLLPPNFEGPVTVCPCHGRKAGEIKVKNQIMTFDLRANQSFCSDYLFDVKPWPLEKMVFKRVDENGEESVVPQSFRSIVEFKKLRGIDSSYIALRYLWRNSNCLTFYVGTPQGVVNFYDNTWPK